MNLFWFKGFYSDNTRRKKGVLLSERVLVIYTEIEVIIREFNKGSMAELVDAPDSKSGHFGGVGSIPSTPTKYIDYKWYILENFMTGP